LRPFLPRKAPGEARFDHLGSGERFQSLEHRLHTADVRTLEQSEFYVADASAILAGDPTVALYVAAILARRLDAANRWLVAVERQLQTGEPPSVIGKAVEKVEELLSYGGRDPTGW
jgi:hypothetical protein